MNDAMAYVCKNCAPDSMALPPQWTHAGKRIGIKLIPCSG